MTTSCAGYYNKHDNKKVEKGVGDLAGGNQGVRGY